MSSLIAGSQLWKTAEIQLFRAIGSEPIPMEVLLSATTSELRLGNLTIRSEALGQEKAISSPSTGSRFGLIQLVPAEMLRPQSKILFCRTCFTETAGISI